MWHVRYMDARNSLSKALEEMRQASYEDRSNPKFEALAMKMDRLLVSVDAQMEKNFKRGHKEGWLR